MLLDLREYNNASVNNWALGWIVMAIFENINFKNGMYEIHEKYVDGECALLNKMVSISVPAMNGVSLEISKNGKVFKGLYQKRLVLLELL